MFANNIQLPINFINVTQGINVPYMYEKKDKKEKWVQLKLTVMCISCIYQQHSGVQL